MNTFYEFSPGERVRIKSYAEIEKTFDSPGSCFVGEMAWVHEMEQCCGRVVYISSQNGKRKNGDASYWLKGASWSWLGAWLESLDVPQINTNEVEELL